MSVVDEIVKRVKECSEPERIPAIERYMMCVPGGYGEGDVFWAVRVPQLRKISKEFYDLNLDDCKVLLKHSVHEIRLLALYVLVLKYKQQKKVEGGRKAIVDLYLKHTNYINNWDLVDSSAYFILGAYCFECNDNGLMMELACSADLWENRIAMIASFWHIRQGEFEIVFKLAKLFFNHSNDLIHKAVGWMLREVGRRNHELELAFLYEHYKKMPRVMLRYAIENFDETLRKNFITGVI